MKVKEIIKPQEKEFELTVTKTELKALLKGINKSDEISYDDWKKAHKIANIDF